MDKMIVLKLDGEVWECRPGWGDDETSVGNVRPVNPDSNLASDRAALAKGITHRQHTMSGTEPCHEVRKLGEVGDGQTYTS